MTTVAPHPIESFQKSAINVVNTWKLLNSGVEHEEERCRKSLIDIEKKGRICIKSSFSVLYSDLHEESSSLEQLSKNIDLINLENTTQDQKDLLEIIQYAFEKEECNLRQLFIRNLKYPNSDELLSPLAWFKLVLLQNIYRKKNLTTKSKLFLTAKKRLCCETVKHYWDQKYPVITLENINANENLLKSSFNFDTTKMHSILREEGDDSAIMLCCYDKEDFLINKLGLSFIVKNNSHTCPSNQNHLCFFMIKKDYDNLIIKQDKSLKQFVRSKNFEFVEKHDEYWWNDLSWWNEKYLINPT